MQIMQQKNQSSTPLQEALISCKLMIKYMLICGFIVNVLMLATPLYSMQVLDRVLSSGNTDTLLMLTIIITCALILLSLVQGARSFATALMGSWFESKLSSLVFKNTIQTALRSRSGANSQQLRDLQTVKTYLMSPGLAVMLDVPWAILFIIVLFILHTFLGMLAILGGIVLVLLGLFVDRYTKPLIEKNNENFIRSMQQVDQAARNAEIIEVMGLFQNVRDAWQKLNERVQNMQSILTRRQSASAEVVKFFRMLLQILVTCIGASLALKNEISTGAIIASSSLVGRALAPFEMAINSWKGYVNAKKSYDRLNAAFVNFSVTDPMSLPEPEGNISGENLYFVPPNSAFHIIKGIAFQINAGDAVCIIGDSGSGKTTLAKLIVGAWMPTIGSVRIDGAKIQDWNREDLGKYIGYLPQDIELFNGTVKTNIARMEENPDSDAVIVAAQLAGVHDMILRLPKGYDTEIGMDGSVLSGGQRQRIALARAFYGTPKMLVLDEPNASLDSYGEAALSAAIEVAKEQGITVIIISHKTSILSLVNKVMVVRDGMLVAFGPTQDVMNKLQQQSV
ncbi:MAG: type I secretion system permease/ATPase [Proteobacteria bacterium]|nr:type I secretion system permease/ATPase [Pseudomonadota bacterium]